ARGRSAGGSSRRLPEPGVPDAVPPAASDRTEGRLMRVAITGGTGFVGGHLARALLADGHEVVLISRGIDRRDESIRREAGARFVAVASHDEDGLTDAFAGCAAVAHCAGINRQIGQQTYARVHVAGTAAVVAAARRAGVRKLVYLSFLRARPNCGSDYHESKWAAEEIVRQSGFDYTVLKASVLYGHGDHLLEHLTRGFFTFPIFPLVGMRPRTMRPTAIRDLVRVMRAAVRAMAVRSRADDPVQRRVDPSRSAATWTIYAARLAPFCTTMTSMEAGSSLRDVISDALRYWELRRLLYNVLLAAVVGAHFIAAWPTSRSSLTLDGLLALFVLAVLANIAYSTVYVADVFI